MYFHGPESIWLRLDHRLSGQADIAGLARRRRYLREEIERNFVCDDWLLRRACLSRGPLQDQLRALWRQAIPAAGLDQKKQELRPVLEPATQLKHHWQVAWVLLVEQIGLVPTRCRRC